MNQGKQTQKQVGPPCVLAAQGRTEYKIVLPVNPTPVQQTAANELASYLKQITGATFPVVSVDTVKVGPENRHILLGPGPASKQLLKDSIDESSIALDGIILKTVGQTLVLSGHARRGTLYAVYTFLEDFLGCRWWTKDESFVPHKDSVAIEPIDYTYAPKLIYRETNYVPGQDKWFRARMKGNGQNIVTIPEELGGSQRFQRGWVHTFYPLIPPQKYFLSHPDWFPEIKGKRCVGYPGWANPPKALQNLLDKLDPSQRYDKGTQLCLTNEGLFQEVLKIVREKLDADPEITFFSFSQNDWHGYCECKECAKVAAEEESQSGPLIRFINRLAEEIAKSHPGVFIDTLAYQYTRKPPKLTKPRDNVVIRLCTIECSFSQTLGEGEQNASLRDDIKEWHRIAPNLFVWDYVTNFSAYMLPHPNYRVLGSNMRFFLDNGVIGMLEQGDRFSASGDFVRLRCWVLFKLLWNSQLDQRALMKEFIAGYYAPEFVPIYMNYFDLLSNAAEKSGVYLNIFRRSTTDWLDVETLVKATAIMDQAVETAKQLQAKDPVAHAGLVDKVQRERLPIDYVWALSRQYYVNMAKETGETLPSKLDADIGGQAWADTLFANFEKYGVKIFSEAGARKPKESFDIIKRGIYMQCGKPGTVPEFCKSLPGDRWFEVQNYSCSLRDNPNEAAIVDDPAASDGKAARLAGHHLEWSTSLRTGWLWQFRLDKTRQKKGNPKYHVYAEVRCDATVDDGIAMTCGLYNADTKKSIWHKKISVKEIKGSQYKLIDMGKLELIDKEYSVWIAPPKRPGEVVAVYVDRFIVIRE